MTRLDDLPLNVQLGLARDMIKSQGIENGHLRTAIEELKQQVASLQEALRCHTTVGQ